jgi:Fe-S oxidoreductase
VKFHPDRCDRCGLCLVGCPELSMEEGAARHAITELIEGKHGKGARAVLSGCSSCFTCNTLCPTGADPYFLVLERWGELYEKRGAPPIYRFVCPNRTDNIWSSLSSLASEDEKALFRRWHDTMDRPGKQPLVLGNYAHLFPHIADSPLFDDFTLIDPIGHWECGAYLTQAGYLAEVGKIARIVKADLDRQAGRELFYLTDSVFLLLTRLIPEHFGTSFAPGLKSFTMWLAESLREGRIVPKRTVNLTLAVHDNCYAKAWGKPLYDAAREVLTHTGARVVELPHNRDESYCCGFGRGAADIPKHAVPFEIMKGALRKIKEAEGASADGLVTYCTGCMYLLWAARELSGSRVAVYHLVEPVTMAMGEYKYADLTRQRERAWDIIALITLAYARSFFQPRFFIRDPADIRYRPDDVPRNTVLRIIRRLLSIRAVRGVYAAGFRATMRLT